MGSEFKGTGFGVLNIQRLCREVGIPKIGPMVVLVRKEGDSRCEEALNVLRERLELRGEDVVRGIPVKAIEADLSPLLATSLGVTECPGMLFFRDRKILLRFDGLVPAPESVDAGLSKILISVKETHKCNAPCDPPCDRRAVSRGMCAAHYNRWRNGLPVDQPVGVQGHPIGVKRSDVPRCNAPCNPPCTYPARAEGLCIGHYKRKLRGADLTSPLRDYNKDMIGMNTRQCISDMARITGLTLKEIRKALNEAIMRAQAQESCGAVSPSLPKTASAARIG